MTIKISDYKAKQLGILTTHVKLKHSGITTSMLNQQSIEINNQLTSTSTGEWQLSKDQHMPEIGSIYCNL